MSAGACVSRARSHEARRWLNCPLQKSGRAGGGTTARTATPATDPSGGRTACAAGKQDSSPARCLPNVFREWCVEADLPKHCSSHGLRKAACRRLAEAGCSEREIAVISGHESLAEVRRYTRAASRARMAKSAMATVTAAFPSPPAAHAPGYPGTWHPESLSMHCPGSAQNQAVARATSFP